MVGILPLSARRAKQSQSWRGRPALVSRWHLASGSPEEQGRDGLAAETPHGVTTNRVAIQNKAKSGRNGTSGRSQRHVRGRLRRREDRAKQSQLARGQAGNRSWEAGRTLWAAA
jgi:hypothetical protein